jgi:hypothetical protein
VYDYRVSKQSVCAAAPYVVVVDAHKLNLCVVIDNSRGRFYNSKLYRAEGVDYHVVDTARIHVDMKVIVDAKLAFSGGVASDYMSRDSGWK